MKLINKLTVGALASLASAGAMAATTDTYDATGDNFETFYSTILGWVDGGLGTGLALAMLLLGAGLGVAKNSPIPALSGVAGAAFLHWGPEIIVSIMHDGALV